MKKDNKKAKLVSERGSTRRSQSSNIPLTHTHPKPKKIKKIKKTMRIICNFQSKVLIHHIVQGLDQDHLSPKSNTTICISQSVHTLLFHFLFSLFFLLRPYCFVRHKYLPTKFTEFKDPNLVLIFVFAFYKSLTLQNLIQYNHRHKIHSSSK